MKMGPRTEIEILKKQQSDQFQYDVCYKPENIQGSFKEGFKIK